MSELEKAAQEWVGGYAVENSKLFYPADHVKDSFMAGAEWQQEQYQKQLGHFHVVEIQKEQWRCGTCKHRDSDGSGFTCSALVNVCGGCGKPFVPASDFGCIMWEKKNE